MPSILFDETHGQLLRSVNEGDPEADTWDKLRSALEQQDWKVTLNSATDEKLLTDEILNGHDVLVIAAPTKSLNSNEIHTIINFIDQGNSLLIANNVNSLGYQGDNGTNKLLETFGLRIKRLLSYPPEDISTFHPHYISSGVRRLRVDEPVYIEILNDIPRSVVTIPGVLKPFCVAVESPAGRISPGRVVAIGDFVLFGDEYIDAGDNKLLTINILRWLAHENRLDYRGATVDTEIRYGQVGTFSIIVSNSHSTRLDRIKCQLESNASAVIEKPILPIRSIPVGGQIWLQWSVEPIKLGMQTLKLTVEFPKKINDSMVFFDPVAQFECVPDAEIDLIILGQDKNMPGIVETGSPFEVQAVVRWAEGAKRAPLHFELEAPLSHMMVEAIYPDNTTRWRLTVFDAGDWPITLVVKDVNETGWRVTQLIRAHPSVQAQLAVIEKDILTPTALELHHLVSQIRREFDTDLIRQIPFRLLTPEDQARLVYPAEVAENLLEVLQVARWNVHIDEPQIVQLLREIAPIYSPVHGGCVPYAPELATHLAKQYPRYEENLANNFLSMTGYDRSWLKQNIAAFLLHEKYGHGFFFNQTLLGQQLAILYRNGLIRQVDYERLPMPYPRLLHKEYSRAIQALQDSSLIVNEGFAAWIELTVLPRFFEEIGQVAYYRHKNILLEDTELARIVNRSEYFKKFQPFGVSRYYEGYDHFSRIAGYFGKDYGPKCTVQAMIKAANVHVGITENNGQVQFGLKAKALEEALLEADEHDARADMRLRRIHDVLRKHRKQIQTDQERLQCHRVCLHDECPINIIINKRLEWR